MKDPGSFSIPIYLGNLHIDSALADLGASVNVMSCELLKNLNFGEPVPTRVPMQLADKSFVHSRGIVKNIMVRVDDLTFPVDFMILDMKSNFEMLLILGWSFVATARSIIDVHERILTLRVEGEYVKIRDSKIQYSANHELCASFVVDDGVFSVVLQELQEEKPKDEPAVQASVARAKKIAKARKKKKEKEGADQIGEETKEAT